MTDKDGKELANAIAKGLEGVLDGLVQGAKEDLQVYALEIAASWTDAIYVPSIAPELEAQEALLAEKYRVLVSAQASAQMGMIRDVVLGIGRELIARI